MSCGPPSTYCRSKNALDWTTSLSCLLTSWPSKISLKPFIRTIKVIFLFYGGVVYGGVVMVELLHSELSDVMYLPTLRGS